MGKFKNIKFIFLNSLLKYTSLLLIALATFFISYFIEREDFVFLIIGILISGVAYFYLIKKTVFSRNQIIGWAILFRISLLFYTPNLSDDYYRFVWDGQMLSNTENPYLILPSKVIESENYKHSKFYHELYEGLNSKEYYTVYPPLNQTMFYVASVISGENIYINVLVLKLIILLFEIGLLFILFALLKALKMAANLAIIYAFNPLVIIELVGNVHFEGVMLFFFLLGVLLLVKNKILLGGLAFAFAISTKLIPLMILPLVIGFIGWKKSITFFAVVGIVSTVLFLPFLTPELISNFGSSIDLYFQKFEFNASIYYLLRWAGIQLTGYNQIGVIGAFLPVIFVMFVCIVSFNFYRAKLSPTERVIGFIKNTFIVLFVYYLLASIVHPWYVINLVVLSVFIKNRVALVWSVTAFFSYFAYSNYVELNYLGDKHQSSLYFWLVAVEYLALLLYIYLVFVRLKVKKLGT
jgi:hypothetical protein